MATVAEGLVVRGVGDILNKLVRIGFEEISTVWGVKAEVKKLKKVLTNIQAVMEDAEKQQVEKETVRVWLKELKEVAYDAEDVLDGIAYETLRRKLENKVQTSFSLSNPLVYRTKIAHKMKDINAKLGEIDKNKETFNFNKVDPVSSAGSSAIPNLETASPFEDSEIVGRKNDELNMVNMLLQPSNIKDNNAVSAIPIVGLGGIGKTTLAQLVYNAEEVKNHFNPRMWIYVSNDFDVKRLLWEMTEYTSETKHEFSNMNLIQCSLQEKLRDKRILLVLDDMWIDDRLQEKWETLRIVLKYANQGSKIIVTTRSNEVAKIVVGSSHIYNLGILPEADSWDLFQRQAFGSGAAEKTPAIEAIGREIVKKCGGVPLAIKCLGGLMRLKTTENEWLAIKSNEIWNIPDVNKKIMNVLKLSYDNLPSPVKRCFSYCSIFLKGHRIGRKRLIQLWMAEGFLVPSEKDTRTLEDIGNHYFNMLYLNCFFQDVEKNILGEIKRCKLHDLAHDLTQFVSGNECSIVDANMIPTDVSEIRYMGYRSGRIIFQEALYEARKLRTFVSYNSDRYGKVVPREMMLKLKLLRVLDLSFTGIKELPSSISKLKHLRYLDLSVTDIEEIPESIARLYNLQTLRLKKCKKLKALPHEFRKLINLRHLHIDDSGEWKEMPKEMGRLTCLQTLSDFKVGSKESGNSITELQHLNHLRGRLRIWHSKNLKNATHAQIANLKGKKNISFLTIGWRNKDDGVEWVNKDEGVDNVNNDDLLVLEALNPNCNLKGLCILNYRGVCMPTWIMRGSTLGCLVEIILMYFNRCEHMPSLEQLPFLKFIMIEGMINVKQFGGGRFNELKETNNPTVSVAAFPSLKELLLKKMPNLEEWLLEEPIWLSSLSFPCLENLFIEECPKLKVTPSSLFPSLKSLRFNGPSSSMGIQSITTNLTSLKDLHIDGCPDLKFLPEQLLKENRLLNTLAITDCPEFEGFLEVEGCQEDGASDSASLPSKDAKKESVESSSVPKESRTLTSLEWLTISGCPKLKSIITNTTVSLPSLTALTICNSDAMAVELFTRNLTSLTSLDLDNIRDLLFLPRNLLHNNVFLESLLILNCSFLQGCGNFLTEHMKELPPLSCLKKLVVRGCHALNSINLQSTYFSSLHRLEIEYCSSLKSFPKGLSLLPNLYILRIGHFCEDLEYFPFPDQDQSQAQIASAHHQNHFASLDTLVLIGWPKLKSLPKQLQHLNKLKVLRIEEFGGLVALPHWLGSLASLEELKIKSCENLMHLPSKEEMLQLISIQYFMLKDCPLLKVRCNNNVKDGEWSKISHIPTIDIDEDNV